MAEQPARLREALHPTGAARPRAGADVATQPTFRWTSAEGAREYRIQVARDPTFNSLLDDVTTNATAYTSSTTYPADTSLYWRVRANDENKVGLAWSAIGTFRRRLPAPALSPDNSPGGETVPVINWSRVQGATSYDMHVDQPDGTTRDFQMGSTAFTAISFYGTGVWRWKVRARFPGASFGETPGPYSASQGFIRRIDAPTGVTYINARRHMLLAWDPAPMAKEYKVQISTTDGFSTSLDTHTTQNTNYAPQLTQPGLLNGGTLYWRVAAVDEGQNPGAWTVRALTLSKTMKVSASGALLRARRGIATVKITDARGQPVRGARVQAKGAGISARPKRSGRKGTARFSIRPRKKGTVVFRARKSGYLPGRAVLRVS